MLFAVCNRTYYGDVGKTYELELGKPLEGRLPFLCHLTFTANGHNHGDIVQVSIRFKFICCVLNLYLYIVFGYFLVTLMVTTVI